MRQDIEFGYYFWGAFGGILFTVVFFRKIYPRCYQAVIAPEETDVEML